MYCHLSLSRDHGSTEVCRLGQGFFYDRQQLPMQHVSPHLPFQCCNSLKSNFYKDIFGVKIKPSAASPELYFLLLASILFLVMSVHWLNMSRQKFSRFSSIFTIPSDYHSTLLHTTQKHTRVSINVHKFQIYFYLTTLNTVIHLFFHLLMVLSVSPFSRQIHTMLETSACVFLYFCHSVFNNHLH